MFAAISASAWALTHVVTKGETISEIAQKFVKGKVYGKSGGIEKILASNPQVKNANLILAGDTLVIPSDEALPAVAQQTEQDVLVRAPANEFASASQDISLRRSYFEVTPDFSFTRLDGMEKASGAKAVLLSSLNYGASAAWHQVWSEIYETAARVSTEKISFRNASTRTLENASSYYSSLSLSGSARIGTRTKLAAALGVGEQIFHRASSLSTATIDKVFIPRFDLGLSQTLITASPFLIGVGLRAGVLLPGSTESYDIRTGYAYHATLYIRQVSSLDPSVERLSLAIFFGGSKQNTSLVDNSRHDLGLALGYKWEFDGK